MSEVPVGEAVSATEAVRTFSDLLNSVKYKGKSYTIIRGGKPIAEIVPVGEFPQERRIGDLMGILKKLPSLGDDAENFARDIGEIVMLSPFMPEESTWE
jgi:prevent-host-death family protein